MAEPNINAFPSVTARETTSAPPVTFKEWRTATGIVGRFRKGPPVARIRTADDLANFYGDDSKPAPIAMRQAMDQGVSNFVVSRAIPSDTPAKPDFYIKTPGTPQEGYVDAKGDEPTEGITLHAEYLSPVATITETTSDIVAKRKDLNTARDGSAVYGDPAFKNYIEGQTRINFRTEMYVDGGGPTETLLDSLKVYNPEVNGSKLLTSANTGHLVTGDDIVLIAELSSMDGVAAGDLADKVKEKIFPGVELELTGSASVQSTATVVSTPEDYLSPDVNGTAYRFAIRVTLDADNPNFGTSDWIELIDTITPTLGDVSHPANDYYVLSYSFAPYIAGSYPEVSDSPEYGEYVTGMFPSYLNDTRVDGFMTINKAEGTNAAEIYSFFTRNDLQLPIQTGLTKPLNLLDLEFKSIAKTTGNVSGDSIGLTPSHLKLLDEGGSVYDRLNKIVNVPSEFAVRVDQGMAYVGRPFTDSGNNNIDPLAPGTYFEKALKDLFTQLNEKAATQDIFSDLSVDITYDRNNQETLHRVNLETRSTGNSANNMVVRVALTGGFATPDDVNTTDWSTQSEQLTKVIDDTSDTFQKGRIGPKRASKVFYNNAGEPLVEVRALGPGKTDLEVSIRPARNGQFDLIVVDRDSEEYLDAPLVERMRLTNQNVVDRRSPIYPATQESRLVRVAFIPKKYGLSKARQQEMAQELPVRAGANLGTFVPAANTFNQAQEVPPTSTVAVGESFVQDVKLTGGDDGDANNQPSPEDYVEATKRLEGFNLAVITNPDITFKGSLNDKTVAALIDQANASDTFNGIRKAVFQMPKRLPIARIKSIVPDALNNDRVRLVAGYITYPRRPELGFNNSAVLGTYIGWVLSRPPYISPAAMGPNEVIKQITSTDIPTEREYLEALSKNSIDAIYFDQSIRRLRFLNGQTTSNSIEGQYVAVSDLFDEITMDLSNRLSFVRSMPLDDRLRKQVKNIVDTRLETLRNRGWINDFRPTVADSRNNTQADFRRGILNVRIDIDPLIPADHIIMNFLRNSTRTLSLQTQA